MGAGRDILANSQLKRILSISSDKKKWNKNEKDKKNMEKENKTDGSDLWKWNTRFKFFETFWDIGDINSRSSDNEEEGAEAVVWKCFAAGSVEKMFLEISQNSQEKTCARVSFLRTAFLKNFSRQIFWATYFPLNFANFWEHLSGKTIPVAASDQ